MVDMWQPEPFLETSGFWNVTNKYSSHPSANVSSIRWPGWLSGFAALLAVAVLLWQPLPGGGPRPAFWLSAAVGLAVGLAYRHLWHTVVVRRLVSVWLCLWVPVMLSVLSSVDRLGTLKVAAVLALALPVGLLWLHALGDLRWRRRIEWALIATLVLWAVDGLVQWTFGTDVLGIPRSSDGRVSGPFDGNLRMATFLALLCPLAFYRGAPRRPDVALATGLGLLFVSLLSGTRTQILAGGLTIVAVLPASTCRRRAFLSATFLAMVALVVALSPTAADRAARTVATDIPAIPGKPAWFSTWDYRLSSRLSNWAAATEMGLQNPTGVGASAFREAYPAYTYPGDQRIHAPEGTEINHAHHVWFALFAEEGWPGVFGLMLAIVLAARWFKAAATAARWAAAPYAASLAIYVFPLALNPPTYLFWFFPVLWLLVCGFLATVSDANKTTWAEGEARG